MEGPKLEAFLSSERRRLLKAMSPHRQLEEVLYLEALVCRADAGETVPEAFGGHDYFTRTAPDADMPTFLRHNHKVGREEVVFDPAEAARDRASAAFGSMTPSPDHALVAYTVDDGCGEGGAIGVRRIGATHDVLEEGISTDVAAVEWASVPGARLLYYTTVDATGRPSTVHRRCMGAPERSSRTVFHEPDAGRFVDVKRTKSRQYLTVNVNDKSASEVWLVDATDPEATPELVRPREAGVEYYVEHAGDRFVIVTNAAEADGSFAVAVAGSKEELMEPSLWRTVVPADPARCVEDVDVMDAGLVLYERVSAAPCIRLLPLAGGDAGREVIVPAPAGVTLLRPGANADPAAAHVRVMGSSPILPEASFDVDLQTGSLHERRRLAVPGFDASPYSARVEWVEGEDGVQVPVTVVHDLRLAPDGGNPVLLRGYGAYGLSLEADYNPADVALLRRGWVLAFAHVRGGGEMGRAWYRQGRQEGKNRSFSDFAACARGLCEAGYTSPGLIAAEGHSAGGLLVATAAARNPGLFGAMVLRAPYLDVCNTMADPALPLTVHEYEEWGDVRGEGPARNVASFCPTQQLAAAGTLRGLPPALVSVGGGDTRVPPWAALHYVARWRARERAEGAGPTLLCEYEEDRGHFGWGGRTWRHREAAREQAFLLGLLGMGPPPSVADPVEESRRVTARDSRVAALQWRLQRPAALRRWGIHA